MAHQRQVGEVKTAEERAAEKNRQKEMKKALTTTNFVLGDEPTHYASANRDAMEAANDFFKGRLFTKVFGCLYSYWYRS